MNYLGIDAGGTFTRLVMMDSQGDVVDRLTLESIHFMRVGFEGITKILKSAKLDFEQLGYDFDFVKVAVGTAGFGESQTTQSSIAQAIHAVFPDALIMNDAKFAMISALDHQDGVYLVSGTGSIAFRIHEGIESRRGGFGYLIGDEGSSFWIGKRLLELFSKEADGRLAKSNLYTVIMNKFKLEQPYDLVNIASEQDDYRSWVAQLSVLGTKAIDSQPVKDIYIQAGKELAQLANSFNIKQKTRLACGGAVLLKNDVVRESLFQALDAQYEVHQATHDVEYAAYLLWRDKHDL